MSRLDEIRNVAKAAAQNSDRDDANQSAQILELPRERAPYQAAGAPTSDPQIRLIIYAKQMFLMPRYDVLYDVAFNGLYEFVGLIFPHQRVRIYGRNLQGVVAGLRTNSVEWLREYVPAFFELPPDDGTLPVITEIQIDGAAINPFEADIPGSVSGSGSANG